VLGLADHPGVRRPVAIAPEDARHHLHVVGETGTGKSTLLANLVLQDAAAGRAAVVIDPKGDLVESILERLPEGCEDRTCVVDPDDRMDAVGLNVLAGSDPDLIVDHVAGVFKRIYEPWWGPRTDDIMRAHSSRNRIVGDVRATPRVRHDRAPQHGTNLSPDLVEVVRLVAHLSSLTERRGDRKVNSARQGATPSADVGGSGPRITREARKPDAPVASGGKRLPRRLTLPVCSSGSEPLGTMHTAPPSLGR
jgi:Type IV secretion-system coupling protein DNA-binding domain